MEVVDQRVSVLLKWGATLWMKCGWLWIAAGRSVDSPGLCGDVQPCSGVHPRVFHKVCTAVAVNGVAEAAKVFPVERSISGFGAARAPGKLHRLER